MLASSGLELVTFGQGLFVVGSSAALPVAAAASSAAAAVFGAATAGRSGPSLGFAEEDDEETGPEPERPGPGPELVLVGLEPGP